MSKKEGGFKVPDELKKTCPICGSRIAKQGWNLHWKFKHADVEFVKFDDVKGGKATPPSKPKSKPTQEKKKESEDKSFPGREGREESGEEEQWRPVLKLD